MDHHYPQRQGIDATLKRAFYYWSSTLKYQLLFSMVYFSVYFLTAYFFSVRYGILDDFLTLLLQKKSNMAELQKNLETLVKLPAYQNLTLALLFAMSFLYPLNLGFYQIFRKIDLKEKHGIEDLFSGYNGINFFKYFGFFLFWIFIYQYSFLFAPLTFIWILITLFSAPLMFFMDKRIFETIALSIQALKLYYIEILVCVIVAFIFRYSGIFIFFVGYFFTFPFWNSIIYALYQKIFLEKD